MTWISKKMPFRARIVMLSSLAMFAFAANSVLARMALAETAIDPALFSVVRLVSGAVFLVMFVVFGPPLVQSEQKSYRRWAQRLESVCRAGSWRSALALFIYAVAFSFAYLSLSTGTGALILFGAVQAAMLGYGWRQGDRFARGQWFGFVLACGGVAFLLAPGVQAPTVSGALMMAVAGLAWASYTLRASATDPTLVSAGNFLRTLPLCAVLSVLAHAYMQVDAVGLLYAALSGIVTSGAGYVVWYAVLPQLRVTHASSVQLSVPALAAAMGFVLLGEALDLRLIVSTLAILAGLGIVLRYKASVPTQ